MEKNTRIVLKALWILFIYLSVSCCNKKDSLPLNVIPLASEVGNYNILNLSDYVSEIKYIQLETNDSVLIGAIPRICYENEKILIKDRTNNCYLFDNNGNFCRKIGQSGQGPNDYLYITQFFITDDLIFLKDRLKILIYDFDGYLVEKISWRPTDFPAEYISHGDFYIVPLKKETFVMDVVTFSGYYPKAILFETNQSGVKIIKEYPNFITLDKVLPIIFGTESGIIYRFQHEVRTYKGINDTIFTIGQDTEMKAAFIYNSGKYGPTLSYFEMREGENARDNYIIPGAIYESTNHLFIEFSFGKYAPEPVESVNSQGGRYTQTDVRGIFDKRTGKLALMRQPVKGKFGFKNDIDGGPVIWPDYISTNNELVTMIQPSEFMEYYDKITNPSAELTEIAHRIEWDDNPIVIVAKLK